MAFAYLARAVLWSPGPKRRRIIGTVLQCFNTKKVLGRTHRTECCALLCTQQITCEVKSIASHTTQMLLREGYVVLLLNVLENAVELVK